MKIFIAIASYCDPLLEHTVRDAVMNARYPERLVFGVVEQSSQPIGAKIKDCVGPAKLRYLHVTPEQCRGLCWARSLVFGLYSEETFLLQVDSHTVFDPDWDLSLVEQLISLSSHYKNPIISTYPLGFEINQEGAIIKDKKDIKEVFVIRPNGDVHLKEEDAELCFFGENVEGTEPILGCHIAGGFLFTFGHFINEVPHDPLLYHRDEQSMAVRAFTHGWNILHTAHVPVQHLYKQSSQHDETMHWFPLWEAQRDVKYYVHAYRAKSRFADMVYGRRGLGRYGLGVERSLDDFARLSGIDYRRRTVILPYQREGYAIA